MGINFGQQHYQRLKLICNVKKKLECVDAVPEPMGVGVGREQAGCMERPIIRTRENPESKPCQSVPQPPTQGPITLGRRKWDCNQAPQSLTSASSVPIDRTLKTMDPCATFISVQARGPL